MGCKRKVYNFVCWRSGMKFPRARQASPLSLRAAAGGAAIRYERQWEGFSDPPRKQSTGLFSAILPARYAHAKWGVYSNPFFLCAKKRDALCRLFFWRSGRDLNPRAAFDGNTISSRARYDHFDTTAYSLGCSKTAYLLYQNSFNCQAIFRKNLRIFFVCLSPCKNISLSHKLNSLLALLLCS